MKLHVQIERTTTRALSLEELIHEHSVFLKQGQELHIHE